MNDKYIIGIDSGSQSTKVYIFNQIGKVIASASEPLKPMVTRLPGYVEHPDDDLWDSIRICLQRIMSEFTGDKTAIVGLGLCSIRCCLSFIKADGTLQAPVMSWMDIRSYATYQDQEDIAFTCSPTGYLTHRLTNEFADSAANAFQWQFPIDMQTWDWSTDEAVLKQFNIPREKLVRLVQPGSVLGYVTEQIAKVTGLPAGIPVVATANDKAVEALGAGIIKPAVGYMSLGTYIASMVVGQENRESPANYWTNLACMPHRFLYESSGVRRGMWLVSWFKSILGPEVLAAAEQAEMSVEEYLEREAKMVPAGSDGLFTIPDWLAPASQLHRKGVMIGFDERHTRGHIYRSILEGIALTMKSNYENMVNEIGDIPEVLVIGGGGSNSDLYMQIFADMFGVTTVRNEINGPVALGAAICVAVATGIYADFETAVENMVRVKKHFQPNPENHLIYQRYHKEAYEKLPQLLEPALKTMYEACN